MKKSLIQLLTGFCVISCIYTQAQSTIWKFGNFGGLKFNTDGTTSPHPASASNSLMAATAITDKDGNLIFYTDGSNLWNKNNAIVTTGLTGNGVSTCAPLIVPVPGQCNKYVVFSKNFSATEIGPFPL